MSKEEIEVKVPPPVRKNGISFKKIVVKEFEKGLLNEDELKRKYNISRNFGLEKTWQVSGAFD